MLWSRHANDPAVDLNVVTMISGISVYNYISMKTIFHAGTSIHRRQSLNNYLKF